MIDQIEWNGGNKLEALTLARLDLTGQVLSFISKHIYTCKTGRGVPDWYTNPLRCWARSVEGFGVCRQRSPAGGQLFRDAADIARDGRDQYLLLMRLGGFEELSQFQRTVSFGPRSFSLISASEPILHRAAGEDGEVLYFNIPSAFVDQRIVGGDRICLRPKRAVEKGLPRLAFETVKALYINAHEMSDTEFVKSSQIVADMVLLALRDSCDTVCGETAVRTANVLRAKRIIRQRMTNPDLTATDIANATGISLSYLYELFHDCAGCTILEYLKNERLQKARDLLTSHTRHGLTVTDVALECGFVSISHFSRSFKAAFGISPREVTRQ